MLNDALIQVQEATSEVQHLASHIEQDPMLLQEIEQRLGQALQLARKHNVKPEELVEWHQKLKAELTALLDFSESEERLILEEKAAFEKMQHTAKQLHESRYQAAEKLAQQVTHSIKGLAMENAEFFTLTYEAEKSVSHNLAFVRIAPLLWLRAGARGERIEKIPGIRI